MWIGVVNSCLWKPFLCFRWTLTVLSHYIDPCVAYTGITTLFRLKKCLLLNTVCFLSILLSCLNDTCAINGLYFWENFPWKFQDPLRTYPWFVSDLILYLINNNEKKPNMLSFLCILVKPKLNSEMLFSTTVLIFMYIYIYTDGKKQAVYYLLQRKSDRFAICSDISKRII